MLAFNVGKGFNQPPAIYRHAGRLRAHSVSSIESDCSHQMNFRFKSGNCRIIFLLRPAGSLHLGGIHDALKFIFLDFPVHGGLADSEQLGGAQAVAARYFQSLPDGVALDFPVSFCIA